MAYKIAMVGSRDYGNLENVVQIVAELPAGVVVLSGGARGVDQVAERAARLRGLEVQVFQPDWQEYGKAAGPMRNRRMVDAADEVIAFWDGKSPGTESTLHYARTQQKPITIFEDERLEEIRAAGRRRMVQMQLLLTEIEPAGREQFQVLGEQLLRDREA